jgi:hypothetical protein
MAIVIEVPPSYEDGVESGSKTITYQLQDELKVGDTTTIIAGSAKRRIRITKKAWIPEIQMGNRLRSEIIQNIPKGKAFSGAFQISYEYIDKHTVKPRKYGEDVDKIAGLIDID